LEFDNIKGFSKRFNKDYMGHYICKVCQFKIYNDSGMFKNMKEHSCIMSISDLIDNLQLLSKSGCLNGVDFEEIHCLKSPPYEFPGIKIFGYDKDGKFLEKSYFSESAIKKEN